MLTRKTSTDPVGCLSSDHYSPTDRELFQLESENIGRIAARGPAIFLGRCGRYILRDHPARFSLFVHADLPDRVARIQQLYCLSADEARKLVETNDRERAAYVRAFTRQDLLDASLYDLCLNTSRLGLNHAVEVILESMKEYA
jgi:cytidylate kinase